MIIEHEDHDHDDWELQLIFALAMTTGVDMDKFVDAMAEKPELDEYIKKFTLKFAHKAMDKIADHL